MKNKDTARQLEMLLRAARRANDERSVLAPAGFSTRVAAKAFDSRPTPLSAMFELLSWRALMLSCLLMAVTIASSYGLSRFSTSATASSSNGDDSGELLDPVSEVLEVAST